MRGRKPIPRQLAELHGKPSQHKLNPHEPRPVGDLTTPPDHFNDEQKASWNYVLANAPPGLLRRIDRGALAVWCIAEDLHRQATIAQNSVPLITKTPAGYQVQSTFIPIIKGQALVMLKAGAELGFSPVSRPRIFGGQAPGEVPLRPVTEEREAGEIPLADYLARPPPKPAVH